MNSSQFCPVAKLDRVLLATDRSTYSAGAVEQAIRFSNTCSSRLFVVTVIESNPEYETIGSSVYEKEEKEALAYLDSVKTQAAKGGVSSCETTLLYGSEPYKMIVEEAARKNADMIIIGRHGRTGIMKVLMGKVAANIIGHAPCKVLVVPRAAMIECRKILVATDGSGHSTAAAAEAIEIAKRCRSGIIALSVMHGEKETSEATANVQAVADMAQKEGVPVETLTSYGKAHDMITETAGGRGVDLIVMGSYGKTGLKKLLMGSTTEKVIGQAGCAVLVARAQ
jgi:nucleotide-binding universal stress UspA family protein